MSLCRYLPTPSDRMSILWSLLSIEDAVVLEYGPTGTTYFSMILYGSLGIEQNGRMYSTHMSEDDVVMGDVSRLEAAIEEVDICSKAKVIFVVASSLSAVIGTDIKGVCLEVQDKVKAKLVAFDHGGLKGDYSVGIMETYKLLCKEISKKNVEKQEKTYNVIGLSMGQYHAKSDLWEVTQLMQEAFGYTLNTALCCETSVGEIENLGSAEINIVLRSEGIAGAKVLEKKNDIPYVLGSPYGYKGTLEWLEEVSKVINVEIAPKIKARLEKKAKKVVEKLTLSRYVRKEKPTATIIGDYDRVKGISDIMNEINFTIENAICDHSLAYTENKAPHIITINKEKDKMNLLKKCHKQLIFADEISNEIANETNTKILVAAPFFKGPIASHFPIMGEKGMDALLEHIFDYLYALQ